MMKPAHYIHGYACKGRVSPEYRAWQNMIKRCYEKHNNRYSYYGGRGIKVCKRWVNSFINFIEDMGPKPNRVYSLDRINVNKNYSPKNCRWADVKTQCRNKTTSIYLRYKGRTVHLKDIANDLGIKYKTLFARYKYGFKTGSIFSPELVR